MEEFIDEVENSDIIDFNTKTAPSTIGAINNPEDFVTEGIRLDRETIAIADLHSVSGWSHMDLAIKKAHQLGHSIRFVKGVEVSVAGSSPWIEDEISLLLYVEKPLAEDDPPLGIESINNLVQITRLRKLQVEDLVRNRNGILAVSNGGFSNELMDIYDNQNLFMGVHNHGDWTSFKKMQIQQAEAARLGINIVAVTPVWQAQNRDYNQLTNFILLANEFGVRGINSKSFYGTSVSINEEFFRNLSNLPLSTNFLKWAEMFRPDAYLKSASEMRELITMIPEAYLKAKVLADMCDGKNLPLPKSPEFPLPEGVNHFEYLRELCYKYADELELNQEEMQRLDFELSVIGNKGLSDLFLFAHATAQFCITTGIRRVGLGSSANSLVCKALKVTSVNPVKINAFFDRFLVEDPKDEPENISDVPDMDSHVDAEKQKQLYQYYFDTYPDLGAALISVTKKFGGREVIKRISRVFDMPNSKEIVHELENVVKVLRGIYMGNSLHPSKIVLVGDNPSKYLPVEKTNPFLQLSIDKDWAEFHRLLRYDHVMNYAPTLISNLFGRLGLKNSDVLHNNSEILKEIFLARTVGIYYLETPHMRNILLAYGYAKERSHDPNFTDDDLAIAFAVSRPATYDSEAVEGGWKYQLFLHNLRYGWRVSENETLNRILDPTHGVLIYQDQVMAVAEGIADFTKPEAQQLRRLISRHRSFEELAEYQDKFISGATSNGISVEYAKHLFDQMLPFSKYGFPTGHPYTLELEYFRTLAYLKFNFPREYFEEFMKIGRGYYWEDNRKIYPAELERLLKQIRGNSYS